MFTNCCTCCFFKSEAIVHPDQVAKYIGKDECQLSYNPLMMALMRESLATRETKLLTASLKKSFAISPQCSWVNHMRCHDDIGWTFDDDLAQQLRINGFDHRRFLNDFYTGRFEGSFAQGVPFQENPETGDCRVCGSLASLTGLEKGLEQNNQRDIDFALKRISLLNSINMSIGGIPLIYQGGELGMLNDYRYLDDHRKKKDSRWVNRSAITEQDITLAEQLGSAQFSVKQSLQAMIDIRKQHQVFGIAATEILETYNEHLFAYCRIHESGQKMLAICNFSEESQSVVSSINDILASNEILDLLRATKVNKTAAIELGAYQVLWLVAGEE